MQSDAPAFATWSHEELVQFAQSSYLQLQKQADDLEQLRRDLKDTRKAYRELILLHEDDGR